MASFRANSIPDLLQSYFLQLDEGKGTAYERYALNEFLCKFVQRYPIRTVLELPANGVMGVPGVKSLALAAAGCEVTLVNPSEKAIGEIRTLWNTLKYPATFVDSDYERTTLTPNSYDLVWNFCVFEHFANPGGVVAEMARLTRKYVLIEIQNVFNIGTIIHKAYHLFRNEPWDHGSTRKMRWMEVARHMEKNGLRVVEVGATDMPPWPDINMKLSLKQEKADFSSYGMGFANLRPSVQTLSVGEILERWKGVDPAKGPPMWMTALKAWHKMIEKTTPESMKILVSHHPYVVGEKK